jgi:hypothetical protein
MAGFVWWGCYVPSTALATSGAYPSRRLPAVSPVLPAAPGAIWKQRMRGGAKNRNPRRPSGDLQPVGSAYRIVASCHRGFPGRQQQAGSSPQIPPHRVSPLQCVQTSPTSSLCSRPPCRASRGETFLRQRSIPPRCRRVTARCGCARARSMRSRCWPQGWHAWWPSSASTAGSGTGYSTCALVLALDADIMGQQQWRQLARQATLWGKRVSVLESVAYGGGKKMSAPRGRRECWRSEPDLQRSPWEVRGSPCLSTSESPGLSGSPSWSRTVAYGVRMPSDSNPANTLFTSVCT